MKINCPLHGDDDVCEQPIDVTIINRAGTRHEPDLPTLTDVVGYCRHAKQFADGDLPETDLEFLLEYIINEEYERCITSSR